jgi:hypothetical protein
MNPAVISGCWLTYGIAIPVRASLIFLILLGASACPCINPGPMTANGIYQMIVRRGRPRTGKSRPSLAVRASAGDDRAVAPGPSRGRSASHRVPQRRLHWRVGHHGSRCWR